MVRLTSIWGSGTLLLCLAFVSWNAAILAKYQASNQLTKCWDDLESADAALAYRAIWLLAKNPTESLRLLQQNLTPATPPDEASLKTWISELASPTFAIRDKAFKELEKQGELAEDALKNALKNTVDLETRRRIESLLERMQGVATSSDKARLVRAVETLELIGTAEAEALLQKLASGFPKHRMTIEAKQSIKRLGERVAFSANKVGASFKPAPNEVKPLPPGVRMRLGTTTFRQYEFLSSREPSFSSDSKLLATPGSNSIYLWETQTGRLQGTLNYVAACLAFSPKESLLAIGQTATKGGVSAITMLDMGAKKEVARIMLPPDLSPQSVLFNLTGNQITVKFSDNSLKVLESPSLKEIKDWKPVDPTAKKGVVPELLAFSADAKHVVTRQRGLSGVTLIDLTNNSGQPLQGFTSSGDQALFSPDGKTLVTLNPSNAGLRIWDVATTQPKWIQKEIHRYSVPMQISPNGKILAAAGSGRKDIFIWNPQTGESLRHLEGSEEFQVGAISPDSNWLAGVAGKTIRIWNLNTGAAVPDGDGDVRAVEHIAFLLSKNSIVTSTGEGRFLFWNMETGKLNSRLITGGRDVPGVAFTSDGEWLVTSDMEGSVGLWNVASREQAHSLLGHGRLGTLQRLVQISPDGNSFFSWSSNDYYLRQWDTKTGRCLAESRTRPTGLKLPEPSDKDSPKAAGVGLILGTFCRGSTFTPRAEQLILFSDRGDLHFFDVATGAETRVAKIGGDAYSLTVSPTGTNVAYRVRDSRTHVLDLKTCKLLFTIPFADLPGQAAYSPDGRTVAAASANKIIFAETATGKIRLSVDNHLPMSKHLAFSPDGRLLVTAMEDTSALVWDVAALAGVDSTKSKTEK